MSQRASGYARIEGDVYETPAWVTLAVVPHLHGPRRIWEPACGSGKMVDALRSAGLEVLGTDISHGGNDFLNFDLNEYDDAIVTNPPFNLATEFVEHALKLMKPRKGMVAMLLRNDFDSAKTRRHLFHDCPAFVKKVVLTRRIVWFERPGAAPSANHAWFIWDWLNACCPVLAYDIQERIAA